MFQPLKCRVQYQHSKQSSFPNSPRMYRKAASQLRTAHCIGLQLLSDMLCWQFHQNFYFPRHVQILANISKALLSTKKWPNPVDLSFLLYGYHIFYSILLFHICTNCKDVPASILCGRAWGRTPSTSENMNIDNGIAGNNANVIVVEPPNLMTPMSTCLLLDTKYSRETPNYVVSSSTPQGRTKKSIFFIRITNERIKLTTF